MNDFKYQTDEFQILFEWIIAWVSCWLCNARADVACIYTSSNPEIQHKWQQSTPIWNKNFVEEAANSNCHTKSGRFGLFTFWLGNHYQRNNNENTPLIQFTWPDIDIIMLTIDS